jgi:hypothetical protein
MRRAISDDDFAGVFVLRAGRKAGAAFEADGEDAGFDGADAPQAPLVFGDGLGEVRFEVADSGERLDNAFAVDGEGFCSASVKSWI